MVIGILNDRSHAIAQLPIVAEHGDTDGHPAYITEMAGKRIAQDNANQDDQRRTAYPEDVWNATSQPRRASNFKALQGNAACNIVLITRGTT